MKLRNSIERLENTAKRMPRDTLASSPLLENTNRVIELTFTAGYRPPEPEDLLSLAHRIKKGVHAGNIGDISRRDWKNLPWCLWLKEKPLVRDQLVCEAYTAWLRGEGRRREYETLIINYLSFFESHDETFSKIGQELANSMVRFDWPWRYRHERFRVFTPTEAPDRIAKAVLQGNRPVRNILDNVGLLGDRAYIGLGLATYKTALGHFKERVINENDPERLLSRILDWATLDQEFNFGSIRGWFANCLLLPWSDTSVTPSAELVEKSRDYLLKHFRDPRLHVGRWNDVNFDAVAVMKRWLARASLEQFFQIVDDVASIEFMTHWPYRRPFWEAYDRIGAIDEAWVAFATHGASRAKFAFEGKLAFGNLNRTSVHPNHAVLLLKIGSLTVAEWSENGKCYIWLQGNKNTPVLYRPNYRRADLVFGSDNDGGIVHASAYKGNWQSKVASFIHRHTSISIDQSDYMPKGWPRRG